VYAAADRVIVAEAIVRVASYALTTSRRPLRPVGVSPVAGRVKDAIDYVHERYCDPDISLKQIARACGTSLFQVSREITDVTGHGLPMHVRSMRILGAAFVLRSSAVPIKQIAYELGFSGITEFGRQFGRTVGMSPSEFRRARHPLIQECAAMAQCRMALLADRRFSIMLAC
jgi:AraC-like DNA-binding protein